MRTSTPSPYSYTCRVQPLPGTFFTACWRSVVLKPQPYSSSHIPKQPQQNIFQKNGISLSSNLVRYQKGAPWESSLRYYPERRTWGEIYTHALGQWRKYGEKDTTMNYMKYLMNQTLSITSKLKDWHGQGTWFHLVVCLTTGPKPLPKRTLHIVRSRASSFKW